MRQAARARRRIVIRSRRTQERGTCLRTHRVRPLITDQETSQRGIEALVNIASSRLLITDLLREGLTRGYFGTLKLAPFRDRLRKGKSVELDSVSSTEPPGASGTTKASRRPRENSVSTPSNT